MKKIKGLPAGRQGFTLLELLVVIGIIAILVSIGTVSYSSAQRSARDSRRRADLDAMRQALEQYYQAQVSPGYPAACDTAANYIQGPWPTDPGSTSYNSFCDSDSYYICATMETESGGNASAEATDSDGTDLVWEANETYYCVANQQ